MEYYTARTNSLRLQIQNEKELALKTPLGKEYSFIQGHINYTPIDNFLYMNEAI